MAPRLSINVTQRRSQRDGADPAQKSEVNRALAAKYRDVGASLVEGAASTLLTINRCDGIE
jgi:hypothetical protein